ncbi:uncharacterized protein LOC111347067 [Stylophora pistillata]|uniref:uncharacterized protein LOC111347067 n=1 Tax=Stylophora pistillata TaxID=50429 RepID=UPI000C03FD0B|nr:uncharacterized protein LOC111347067 [Stylophora pistillata]
MKQKLKVTLWSSEKKSSWTAKEAFSVLTEAKKEDEKKRATLLDFYKRSVLCLNKMDEKVQTVLEKNIANLKDKIVSHQKDLLQKEYIVLVAGETRSGKSTLLNLILGEQLLPYSLLSTTSAICELKYGDTPQLVAHFKDKKSGDTTKTVLLKKPSKAFKQTYLQQISTFLHLKTDSEKGSDYEKVELFWPHNLLKENVVIVDSPGIGESPIMDDIVKKYLPEAFAFIYVINSENAGGIQRDRVEERFGHARQVFLEKQRVSLSNCALFVCNKWDLLPSGETDEVKNYILRKLKQCWPSLDPESQIIYMSAKHASEAQKLGVVTEEFGELMNGIKSMVLKLVEERLQIKRRWLDYVLALMVYHTKTFMRNSSGEERMKLILHDIERLQDAVSMEMHTSFKKETDNVCVVHQAFSVSDAKKGDDKKRATLLNFYERTDVCLSKLGGKALALLEQTIGNFKEKIVAHKQNLKKEEFTVIVVGTLFSFYTAEIETSAPNSHLP